MKMISFIKRHSLIFYIAMSVAMIIVMAYYSKPQSFWYDELFQLGLSGKKVRFQTMIQNYSELWDYTPPLYAIIIYVWIRIVPFTHRFLLLPTEIFVGVGIVFLALLMEKAYSKKAGVITSLLGVSSVTLVVGAGHEFRTYALFFMAAAISLYSLAQLISKDTVTIKDYVICGLSFTFLAYTHYYGVLVVVGYFLWELLLFLRKKRTVLFMIPYFLSGALFLPWMIAVLLCHRTSMTEFWTEPPDGLAVLKVILYLSGDNIITNILFGAVVVYFFVKLVKRRSVDSYADKDVKGIPFELLTLFLFTSAFILFVMVFYAAVINREGGAFYERYFMGIYPCVMCFTAWGMYRFMAYIEKKIKVKKVLVSYGVMSAFFIVIVGMNFFEMKKEATKRREPYEQSVQLLKKKGDIEKKDTAIMLTDCTFVTEGYKYFFEDLGKNKNVFIFSQEDEKALEYMGRYNKIYVLAGHRNPLLEENELYMKEKFECLYKDGRSRVSAYKRKS